MGQTPRSGSQCKNNFHVNYQSSSTHSSKVITKVKVFKKWFKLQGQGHRVKIMVPTERSFHRKYSCEVSKL